MGARRSFGLAFALVALGVALFGLVPSVACATVSVATDTITGYAQEANTHARIAGADVYLETGTTELWTTTDASGTYAFTGLPVGDYSVWASKTGYHFITGWSVPLDGTSGWFRTLDAYQASLQGLVTYRGAPVRDADVTLYSRVSTSSPWTYYTDVNCDSSGHYYFYNAGGAEFVVGFDGGSTTAGPMKRYYHSGASTLASATPLALSLATTMTIDLPLTLVDPSITGRVSNADGSHIASGSLVVAWYQSSGGWSPYAPAWTDALGNYKFLGLPDGVWRVGTMWQPDRSVLTLQSFYTTSGPCPSNVASASDVTVAIGTTSSDVNITVSGASETLTRDAYEVDDLQSQAKPVVVGGATQAHTLLPAGDDDWMSFQVTAGHTYRIETTTSPIFPLWSQNTDTYLYLYDSDGKTKITYNDDRSTDTRSLIEWTAPATKTVYTKVTDYESATGDGGSERGAYGFCVTDLGSAVETGSVSGRVTDSVTATGVPGARVTIGDHHICFADGLGYYRVNGLAADDYSVYITAPGYGDLTTATSIPAAGDQVTQDFALVPSSPATAQIMGYATGAYSTVSSATVTAVADGSGATTSTLTDGSGGYSFPGMEPGTYTVAFSKSGFVGVTYSGVSVDAGEIASRCGYLVQLGRIHGSITASSGPLAGVSVVVDGSEATKTAPGGTYSVGDVALGLHTLRFSAGGFSTYSQEFAIDDADSLTIDRALTTQTVVPTKPRVTRSPSKPSLTYKRKHGRATFALGVNVRDVGGQRLGGVLVLLQRSYDGKHWTQTYRLMTNASGTATKPLYGAKKQKMYFRWVVTATSTHKQVVTAKQKVTIK